MRKLTENPKGFKEQARQAVPVHEEIWRGRILRQRHIDWFRHQGVAPLSLGRLFVFLDSVVFGDVSWFEFARHLDRPEAAVSAFTILAQDQVGAWADIVAWHPKTGRLASWLGTVALLGEEQLYGPRLSDALTVHPDPLSWLRDEGRGVVIVDETDAAPLLRDAEPLMAADLEHGRHLLALLTETGTPGVFIPWGVS